mgnify:CR=1 FL=1
MLTFCSAWNYDSACRDNLFSRVVNGKRMRKTASAEQLEDVYIGLAYGFMEEEAYEEAENFSGELSLFRGVYDDAYLLARARLYGLQENYDGAEGLYRMLIDRKSKAAGRNELKEELEVIERAKKEADEDAREDAKNRF